MGDGFDLIPVHMEFVVDKVAVGQVPLHELWVSPARTIMQIHYINISFFYHQSIES